MSIFNDPTYRVESTIGEGGGGVVYKAWHTRLQKYVVIKELKRGSEQDIETQRNEVEALKNVKSEFLPQVFDFLTEGDRIFTVIEYIEGNSLDKLLERGQKFTQLQVVKWYGQLVSALEAIHKQDVYHRDIKPANIMLTSSGDVCLIDFNAALVSGNDVRLISRSLGYASPEQYEIYERFKNTRGTPIHFGGSSDLIEALDTENATELLGVTEKTELISECDNSTELILESIDANKTELISPLETDSIDWKCSDIYSLGATMYHLLTGKQPPERTREVIPVSKLGRFGEGITYVIEQSMQLVPSNRFATVQLLSDAVRNLHKHDRRWKVARAKMITAAAVLPLIFAVFTGTALLGSSVMAQEKEERFFTAVHNIIHGDNPQFYFDSARDMFWNRIYPFLAMARRLWDDGDIEACRNFIEANLGYLAAFQAISEAHQSLGDIYYILGNTYYFQAGEPDYHMARSNFAIAIQFATSNPNYFRDYGITLARTGYLSEATQALEQARALGLDTASLSLLNGEIAFVQRNFDEALRYFDNVILMTTDDYVRYRAFHASDEIFRLLGQPESSVELLYGALNRISLNRVPEMTERLADAYVRSGNYESALALFEQLLSRGAPQFHLMQNMVILLQNAGELYRAADMLVQMTDFFPNDYRIPMRQAFLEADRQSRLENEERDYAQTELYFIKAKELYRANIRPGQSDPEMQQLELLIEQLRQHGWID